ncbi:hypothetical protein I5H06_gp16 [Mycobacterium phage SirPhilip]|uniref:Uncharacterized protein n=1 Tax=Mycobacterium phage SirPhilip TaxID=2015824 RepID=A0A222ZLE8_9CAUD|nr:hypothetical protein I5H06_gp16 [Mycobacterium phage SirPhilip]ASR85288.1 hypothetical protein SEA_SIRPHILIP_86 [Mycobacterium phage SirPhilip]
MMAHISVDAGRQQGKTTALLDVAIANARRGLVVDFWSQGHRMSENAFQLARDLVPPTDEGVTFSAVNGAQAIRYPSGGGVQFKAGGSGKRYGYTPPGADMEVIDGSGRSGSISRPDKDDRSVI